MISPYVQVDKPHDPCTGPVTPHVMEEVEYSWIAGDDLFAAARLDHLQRMEQDYFRRRMAGQSEEEAQEAVQKEFDNPYVSTLPA